MIGMNPETDSIQEIENWFKEAVPVVTSTNVAVQLGCHFEEVAEMIDTISSTDSGTIIHLLEIAKNAVKDLADYLKETQPNVTILSRVELLDAICDQIVTGVGVAVMNDMDVVGGIKEVNRSNYSKFENGEAVFKENGKIKKGVNYSEPDLTGYVT